jgi:hypothetical protein
MFVESLKVRITLLMMEGKEDVAMELKTSLENLLKKMEVN